MALDQRTEDYFRAKKILITGAGAGIGRELAIFLAPLAGTLVLNDLRSAALEETKALLKGRPELKVQFVVGDVRELATFDSVLECPDVIIANAGLGGINPGYDFDSKIDRLIMEVNYFGTSNLISLFGAKMAERKSGHFVGVCSLASMRGLPLAASYSSSKAAQLALLESVRNDLRPYNVFVSTLLPGFIKTAMADHNEFDRPFMITPVQCAQQILEASARKCRHFMFPWPMKILSLANRFMPAIVFDFLLPRITKAYDHGPKMAKIFGIKK